MKHSSRHLVLATLLATLGLAATAQPAPGPAGTPGAGAPQARGDHMHRFDPAKMQERKARRLADLKQKLQLSPGQEMAWSTYVAALTPPAGMGARIDRAEFEKLTTPERIDRMRALRTERIAQMDKRGEATKTLYAQLTPEQKKVFDANTMRRGGRHGGMHRG